MEQCTHRYCQLLQAKYTPLEHEDESTYISKVQAIRDTWYLENINHTKEYLTKEIWFQPSNTIEQHHKRVSLDDEVRSPRLLSEDTLMKMFEDDEENVGICGRAIYLDQIKKFRNELNMLMLTTLSDKQQIILDRLLSGRSKAEIAREVGVSPKRISDQVVQILKNLKKGVNENAN